MKNVFESVTELFDYNRENFQNDRRQRQVMEYQLANMRIEQAKMWREDIRDVAELTPQKMEVYLLVIALELGFCVMALCKGRVPPGAPPWLVACHTLAVCAALMYLFLAMWFGMHAFVSSQAYKVRILTQLVRLPIPSWRTLEASRTYSSAFERLGPRQMLRVPFATGGHERLAQSRNTAGAGASSPRSATDDASPTPMMQTIEEKATADPWGLERPGEGIAELAPDVNAHVERQRHIWLVREASKYYQTYDAFCRISLSAGTSSFSTFLCYFCMSYVLTENAAPAAAWGGMAVFIACAMVIMRGDLLLTGNEFLFLSFLKVLSPTLSAIVTFKSSKNAGNPGGWEYLMPIALFCHGLWHLTYLYLFKVRQTHTGAYVPIAFSAVLFMDAFSWAKHRPGEAWNQRVRRGLMTRRNRHTGAGQRNDQPQRVHTRWNIERRPSVFEETNLRPRATSLFGYEEGVPERRRSFWGGGSSAPTRTRSGFWSGRDAGGPMRSRRSERPPGNHGRDDNGIPTMDCVNLHTPSRPEDVEAPLGQSRDDDNPQITTNVSFRPGTFSSYQEDHDGRPDEGDAQTGTDIHGERPGLVPWRVFFINTVIVSMLWWFASGVALLNAYKGTAIFVQAQYGEEEGLASPIDLIYGKAVQTTWGDSLLMRPRGLACDAKGEEFVTSGRMPDGSRGLWHGRLGARAGVGRGDLLQFSPAPSCGGLDPNTHLQDLSMHNCGEAGGCSALVLPQRAHHLVTCPLNEGAMLSEEGNVTVKGQALFSLGRDWLEDRGGIALNAMGGDDESEGLLRPEEFSSLSVAPCAANASAQGLSDCIVVGTTARRVVQLKAVPGGKTDLQASLPWVPRRLLRGDLGEVPDSGAVTFLGSGHIAMLQRSEDLLTVSDLHRGGAAAGMWRLQRGQRPWAAICAGGGYLYAMEDGEDPMVWRFRAPAALSQEEIALTSKWSWPFG
mmetsp:Transcript_7175/g.15610  ORF Transcript_7175/g.15610 Transcript_7175/m.15610 type:complete len:954 (+) Transcript_7175:168-3029(+)